jgi:hypothetical protein
MSLLLSFLTRFTYSHQNNSGQDLFKVSDDLQYTDIDISRLTSQDTALDLIGGKYLPSYSSQQKANHSDKQGCGEEYVEEMMIRKKISAYLFTLAFMNSISNRDRI